MGGIQPEVRIIPPPSVKGAPCSNITSIHRSPGSGFAPVPSLTMSTALPIGCNGAHVLRHSAATTMLRHGASLAGIGAVLRHRSPRTTAYYAKVDFGLLSEIAQPWPEVPSC